MSRSLWLWLLTVSVATACGKTSSLAPDAVAPADRVASREVEGDLGGDGRSVADLLQETDDAAVPEDTQPPECETGEMACQDAETVVVCLQEQWTVTQVCTNGKFCLEANCVTDDPCQPGHVKGCYSPSARNVCHASGRGYVPWMCPTGQQCLNGKCAELACVPGVSQCAAPDATHTCLPDGSGWSDPSPCADGEQCVGGQCLSGCAGDIKYNQSNVGCEFWSTDLGQWDIKEGDNSLEPSASIIPHAVIVGNPNQLTVKVTFETGDGTPVTIPEPTVAPGQVKAFVMPVMSLQYTGITQQTIRLRTNHPVTAAQFNPPSNKDFVHTSDASLLYPVDILGTEHFVVSMASMEGPTLPMLGKSPSVWGYVTVVAVAEGTTTLTVGPLTAATEAGGDLPAYEKGAIFEVTLQQWEVLNLQSRALGMFAEPVDLTGTRIKSDQPVAVFGGHDCTVIGDSNCDHLESQLLPVEAWGKTYVAGRMDTPSPNEYRIVSASDGNAIATSPPVGQLNGLVLNKGEWVHVKSDTSFVVEGSAPLQVIQFIAGNSTGGAVLVDPSMTTLVPIAQFRDNYPFLVPTAYTGNQICVARQGDSPLTLNGQPLTGYFAQIPGTDWQVANVSVSEGINEVSGDAPFGLISYGYASKVSYAYPGGMNGVAAD